MAHTTATFILPLNSAHATLARVGGKGVNLAELTRAEFPVPRGFCITTEAYQTFAQSNTLHAQIAARLREVNANDSESITRASSDIRAWFDSANLALELENAITHAYTDLGNKIAVAVRSSATAEDLSSLSFAGQQETFLNIVGQTALLDAVKKCWASLWNARALDYRARHKIANDAVALAVVVQEMVLADASGIIFTANPMNGQRGEIIVEASVGLGEAIVSGQVEPDYYVIRGEQIIEKQINTKTIAITPRAGGGTKHITLDTAEPTVPNEQILALAQLATRIAAHFGTPQDIEWAIADGKLWLLQSRPITTLNQ